MKVCRRCKVAKEDGDFYKSKRTQDGLQSWCKSCARENSKEWVSRHRDWYRKYEKERYQPGELNAIKREFRLKYALVERGITFEEYQTLVETQGGKCAICGRAPGEANKREWRLSIDHDHKTGKVRGLLCAICNPMIGLASDDPEILQKAVDYLRKYQD